MAPVQKPVNEDEIMGLPKWVWAAIAGGVITTGLAIYIFTGDSDGKKKKPKKKAAAAKNVSTTNTPKATPKKATATPKKAAAKVTVEDAPEEDDIEKVGDPDFVYFWDLLDIDKRSTNVKVVWNVVESVIFVYFVDFSLFCRYLSI